MERILFIDKNKNNYYPIMEKLDNYFMSYTSETSNLKKTINKADPDIIIYVAKSKISLHSVISSLLESNNEMTPILVFGFCDEPISYELVFGPFSFNDSIESIIKITNSYKKLLIENSKLKENNSYLKEGVLSEDSEEKLRTFESFKTQIIQEFKRLKRTDKPLSLIITSVVYEDATLEHYSSKLINDINKRISHVVQESIRDTDIPLSYNENKVIVLMPDTDKKGLEIVISRIHSEVNEIKINQLAKDFDFEIKIGYAVTNGSIQSFSELVKKALDKIKQ